MNALIVHAHEEPKSFNGAMRDTAVATLSAMGAQVVVSDLYAMNFDPVGGRRDFTALANPDYFKYGAEQTEAAKRHTFIPEVAAEQEKLKAADLLVFQFPLWWFGMPAILKGWVDRVMAAGFAYGGGRWYTDGVFRGRRAMCALTTGGGPSIYGEDGLNGDIHRHLFSINHGIFAFCGFDALPPMIAWAPARVGEEQRLAYLAEYAARLRNWQHEEPIKYPPLSAYDASFALRKG